MLRWILLLPLLLLLIFHDRNKAVIAKEYPHNETDRPFNPASIRLFGYGPNSSTLLFVTQDYAPRSYVYAYIVPANHFIVGGKDGAQSSLSMKGVTSLAADELWPSIAVIAFHDEILNGITVFDRRNTSYMFLFKLSHSVLYEGDFLDLAQNSILILSTIPYLSDEFWISSNSPTDAEHFYVWNRRDITFTRQQFLINDANDDGGGDLWRSNAVKQVGPLYYVCDGDDGDSSVRLTANPCDAARRKAKWNATRGILNRDRVFIIGDRAVYCFPLAFERSVSVAQIDLYRFFDATKNEKDSAAKDKKSLIINIVLSICTFIILLIAIVLIMRFCWNRTNQSGDKPPSAPSSSTTTTAGGDQVLKKSGTKSGANQPSKAMLIQSSDNQQQQSQPKVIPNSGSNNAFDTSMYHALEDEQANKPPHQHNAHHHHKRVRTSKAKKQQTSSATPLRNSRYKKDKKPK